MKYLICSFILVLVVFSSCEKGDPEIAPNEELSALSFNESFICQPLAYDNHLIALIDKNNITSICNFDEHGNRLWQNSVDQYLIPGSTFANINDLSLNKGQNGEFCLKMSIPYYNAAQNLNNWTFTAVFFDGTGNLQKQILDNVHQPDTIIINQDTMSLHNKFINPQLVSLKNGQHIVISSQIEMLIDSTYLQFSTYSNKGDFLFDKYFKFKGIRNIQDVLLTSDGKILFYSSTPDKGHTYFLMDSNGKIIFEIGPMDNLPISNYFLFETSQQNFIISASEFDNASGLKGFVSCFDKTGNILWNNDLQGPLPVIMSSVQERSDGYIFSGFTTSSTLLTEIDWRTTFLQNKSEAVIHKTGLNGQTIWMHPLLIRENTAGAATIGNNNISIFCGKYLNSIKNIVLLKLDAEKGNILN